jgi:hypothetical protein
MARGKQTRNATRLFRSMWLRATAGLVLWTGGSTFNHDAVAQSPTNSAASPQAAQIVRYHLNKHTIQLPIQLDEQFRPILSEIHLYVKESPTAPWALSGKAPPSQTSFTFKAPRDGEYYFTMVTVDREGRCAPQDVSKEQPAMAIVVDTQAPQTDVVLLGTPPEGHLIQCDVRDAHLDASRTRVQYQTADKAFRDLEAMPNRPNVYCIPAQANITGMIRVTAADQAGNLATRECSLTQLPMATTKVASTPMPAATPTPAATMPESDPKTSVVTAQSPAPKEPLAGPQLNLPERAPVVTTGGVTVAPASQSPAPTVTVGGEKTSVPNRLAPSVGHASPLDNTVPQASPLATETAPKTTQPAQAVIQKTSASEPLAGPNLGTEPVATAAPAPSIKSVAPSGPATEPTPTPPAAAPTTTAPAATVKPAPGPTSGNTPATVAAKRDGAPVHHLLVNSPRVFLEYRIDQKGPSGVGRVEIWCTRDRGQSWQCLGEDKDRKSPAEARLPGDGVYGLTLVVSNGLGFGAQPPAPGDTPDWWIEVDTTQPSAQLTMVRTATEDVPGVHIGWTSKDRNLGSGPVELSYATSRQGPWMPMVKGLKAEGQYRWVPPMDIGPQAYLRLTVRDLAGNTTITETTQPVMLDDLSRPRAGIVGITTEAVSAPAPKTGGQ